MIKKAIKKFEVDEFTSDGWYYTIEVRQRVGGFTEVVDKFMEPTMQGAINTFEAAGYRYSF